VSPLQTWAVVPAHLGSRRLPRKVLCDIHGRTMLEHVWRRVVASDCFARVVIACHEDEVARVARSFGADVILAGPARNGTERVAMAVGDAPVAVVNVQADQPLVDSRHLARLVAMLDRGAAVATLCTGLTGDLADPARVKVRWAADGRAIRFSRRPLGPPHWLHVGLYGFAAGWIRRCADAPPSAASAAEDLEQLAWMDAGVRIDVGAVDEVARSVDTPHDLERVRAEWSADGHAAR
jgi:3-deoxy-manno-octulosonate cytidylyltransferase (CMP-KDO synthetase)